MRFAERKKLENEAIESLLIEVDRLKSEGDLSDSKILVQHSRVL